MIVASESQFSKPGVAATGRSHRSSARVAIGRVLPVVFFVMLAGFVPAEPAKATIAAEPSESDFVAGLEAVRELMEESRWKAARTKLLELLERHEGEDHVRFRLSAIREELQRCATRIAVPRPELETLVSGRLVSYVASTGAIHLRYAPEALDDFEHHGDFLVHPISFTGPYTIEVRGREYTRAPVFAVGLEGDRSLQICFGSYEKNRLGEIYASALLLRSVGESTERLDSVEKPDVARVGKPYVLRVSVTNTHVSATFNGRRLLSAKRDRDPWGQIGFSGLPAFEEIIVRGEAGTAWVRGLLDASTRDAERAFLAGYDVDNDLPPWLRGQSAPEDPEGPREEILPWRVSGPQVARAEKLTSLLAAGEYSDTLHEITSMDREDLPDDLQIYFAVSAYVGLRLWHKAIELNEGLLERNPDFLPVRALHASLLGAIGSRADAIREYERVLAADDQRVECYRGLAELRLLNGELPAARAVLLSARKAGVRSSQLERIEATIAKAARGPNWDRVYEIETEHYRIVSDIDRKTCVEAGDELEAAYRRYEIELGPTNRPVGHRSRVFLFAGEAGYDSYIEGLFDTSMQSTAGMYSYSLKQLLIWNLPARAGMMETVRHEAVHQYLDEAGYDPPTWFNEGLAEYLSILEEPARGRGRAEVGGVDGDAARLLVRNLDRALPLAQFLYLEGDAFYRQMSLHYAQAWAFVHFLRHSTEANELLYRALLLQSRSGAGKKRTVDRVFQDVDLNELDAQFREYVRGLTKAGE